VDPQPHPYLIILMTLFSTLLGKYLWDRFFSQSSRITREQCKYEQAACRQSVLAEIKIHTERLSNGDLSFHELQEKLDEMNNVLAVLSFAVFELCRDRGIDCNDIVKLLTQKGIVK
jgi:hypothetical protein